jgi:alpha-L-glutamate ligase-like protein
MKLSSILGLNARSQLFTYKHNGLEGKRIAKSKIKTGRVMKKAGIPYPTIFAKFKKPEDIEKYDWTSLPEAFALKPSKGLGGEGIIVVKKKARDGNGWITTQRNRVTINDLKFHTMEILEGAYSMDSVPDVAFIQEYVGRHKSFRKYAFRGTPDIRIIVFNKIPVLAMLRLPTKESGGRANLHQGAIGVGIDIATGITTKAIWHGKEIKYKPDSTKKLHGIKIPNWSDILLMAVRAQEVSRLGYLGVDIVLHPEKGPMVLELNSQPGLQIQLANMVGLRRRLDRIDDLDVIDAEHGVKIAKALFSNRFSDRIKAEEGIKTISAVEKINVRNVDGGKKEITAKIDTGAWTSSIDKNLAKELGLYDMRKILWYKNALSALGTEKRPVIDIIFWLAGRRIKTVATVANRKDMTYPMIIGRSDLVGFLVDPTITNEEN